jgi:uncharacterized protein with GYD domain
MATYLVQTSYTQQALAAMVKKAQNRTEPIRKAVEKLGGSLVGLWLSFGKHDVVCMMEMPDNISAAAMAIAVALAVRSRTPIPRRCSASKMALWR